MRATRVVDLQPGDRLHTHGVVVEVLRPYVFGECREPWGSPLFSVWCAHEGREGYVSYGANIKVKVES